MITLRQLEFSEALKAYMDECLKDGNTLSRRVYEKINLEEGKVYAALPQVFDLSRLPRYEHGGIAAQKKIKGKAGDAVGVAALDGGSIDRDNPAEILTLNEAGAAELNFTLSANPGVSRVSVQYGAQTTTLDFWGGPNNVFPQLSGAALKSIVR